MFDDARTQLRCKLLFTLPVAVWLRMTAPDIFEGLMVRSALENLKLLRMSFLNVCYSQVITNGGAGFH